MASFDELYESAIEALQKARKPVADAFHITDKSKIPDDDQKTVWRDVLAGLDILIRNAQRAHHSDSRTIYPT